MHTRFTIAIISLCTILVLSMGQKDSAPSNPEQVANKNSQSSSSSDTAQKGTTNANESPTSTPPATSTQSQTTANTSNRPDSQPGLDGSVRSGDKIIAANGQEFPLRQYKTMLVPNDPFYNQWWVAPNGMTAVWDIPIGARMTKVAVIDTGFALDHQEFAGRWAINSDEISGNGIDDDGNGLVDDWRGWDFTSNTNNVQAGKTNPNGSGTTHGTMVAGILGATGNNGVGIAGVNWFTSILPIQAIDDDEYGDSFTVGQSVYYAADQGADVISLSLGTSADDPYLRLAIRYAIDRGSVVVAASGNDGCNCISFPANYPEVIAVGAIDPSGNRASFSSFGANLDVVGPGQSMTSAFWTPSNQTSAYAGNIAGTSFSTPFVAGLLSYGRMLQPEAAWEEIFGSMLENSDRRSFTAASPRNDTLGFGVARANTMLQRLTTPNTSNMRYQFSGGFTGSGRAYQCNDNTIPATHLYELAQGGAYRYTANLRELSKGVTSGAIARQVGFSCIGLPSDTVDVLRIIDLRKEIRNSYIKN